MSLTRVLKGPGKLAHKPQNHITDPFNTQTPGPASKYIVTPNSLTPVLSTVDTIMAQLTDAAGIPVLTAGLVVTWSKTGAGGSFSAATSTTDATGRAYINFTVAADASVNHTVTATDTNAMTGTSAVINVAPLPATHYVVTPASLAPEAGATDVITAQLADVNGDPVATSGRVVTWSKTGTGGSLSAATSTTNGSGVATVTLTVATDASVNHTVTATDTSALTGTSTTIDVVPLSGATTAAMQSIIDGLLDGGDVYLYGIGTKPAAITDPATGSTLLMTWTFDIPAATSGDLITNSSIALAVLGGFVYVANAGAKWARIRQADGTVVADVTVGVSGSGAALIIADNSLDVGDERTLTLTAAGVSTITSFTGTIV